MTTTAKPEITASVQTRTQDLECAGGLGGLGLLFARWAAAQSSQHVTLLDTCKTPLHGSLAGLQAPDCPSQVSMILADVAFAEQGSAQSAGSSDSENGTEQGALSSITSYLHN